MNYHLTPVSSNAKTGPIPVSTSHKDTCPDACPLKAKGCYAAGGPSNIHWKAVTEGKRGTDWEHFLLAVRAIRKGSLWRHNQAGDLPGLNAHTIDREKLEELTNANKGRKGFTYTHYDVLSNGTNVVAVHDANLKGFTINLSGNNMQHADELKALNIAPVVVIMPVAEDNPKVRYTPAGNKVVRCPAEYNDKVSCATCGLCQVATRDYIIGFTAHGVSKKHVSLIAKG
ncbi:hypothetical protein Amme3_00102 [Pseudomonas phage vB_PpuM-Amme-3]|uniref:DUF7227 domain-containing protein n=1 Tax=Pseudomonas phage vB_PpuM-Amme-3 TaxID=3132617 RepID=A0AAX4MYH4_9CAUD